MEILRGKAKKMSYQEKLMLYEQKKKSPGIAVLLSLIIPGAGQMYLGKVGKGIILLIFFWTIIAWLYSIFDAYKYAKDYNARLYFILFGKEKEDKRKKEKNKSKIRK